MPVPQNKSTSNQSSSASLDGLSQAIISAIESGFEAISETAAKTGGVPGAESSAPVGGAAAMTEPSGGIGPAAGGTGGGEGKGEGAEHKFRSVAQDGWGGFFGAIKDGAFEEKSAFPLGYSFLEMSEGIGKRVEKLGNGQFVTQEERQSSLAEAALPGLGGVVGTALGFAAGNPVLGGFVGNAAGEVVTAGITAKDERDQATRETAERLASALGGAETAVSAFRTAIEATGAPVQQLSAGLVSLLGVAPGVGSEAVVGAGRMALAEGTDFVQNTQTLGTFLGSNPGLYQAKAEFAQKGTDISEGSYQSLAHLALSEDNMPAYQAAKEGETAKRYSDDPDWNKRKGELDAASDSWAGKVNHFSHQFDQVMTAHLLPGISQSTIDAIDNDPIADAQKSLEERQEELDKKSKEQSGGDAAFSLARGKANADLLRSTIETTGLENRFRASASQGGSAAQQAAMLPGIRAALDEGARADDVLIAQDKAEMARPGFDKAYAPAYEGKIAALEADKTDRQETRYQQYTRQVFQAEMTEHTSAFSLAELHAQIEGKSASEIQQTTKRESAYLSKVESDPNSPLSPEEKAGIEKSRLSMVYQAQQNVFTERLTHDDNLIGRADAGTSKARSFGSEEDLYRAQGAEIDSFKAKITELGQELRQGGQTVADYARESRALTETQAQASRLTTQRRDERIADTSAMDAAQIGIETAGLSRTVALGGSTAIPQDKIDAAFRASIIDDEAAVNAYAPGSKGRKLAEATLAQERVAAQDFDDKAGIYSPDVDTRIADTQGEGRLRRASSAFQRSLEIPYLDGLINSDPLTRGNELLGELTKDEARRTADFGKETARRTQQKAAGKWTDLAEESYLQDQERFNDAIDNDKNQSTRLQAEKLTAMFNAVPEMIIGGAGLSSGVRSAVTTTAAMSAMFEGSPIVGHFGPVQPRAPHASAPHPYFADSGDNAHDAKGQAHSDMSGALKTEPPSTAALIKTLEALPGNIVRALTRARSAPGSPQGAVYGREARNAETGRI